MPAAGFIIWRDRKDSLLILSMRPEADMLPESCSSMVIFFSPLWRKRKTASKTTANSSVSSGRKRGLSCGNPFRREVHCLDSADSASSGASPTGEFPNYIRKRNGKNCRGGSGPHRLFLPEEGENWIRTEIPSPEERTVLVEISIDYFRTLQCGGQAFFSGSGPVWPQQEFHVPQPDLLKKFRCNSEKKNFIHIFPGFFRKNPSVLIPGLTGVTATAPMCGSSALNLYRKMDQSPGNQRFGEKNDPYGAGASRENFRFHSCCFYFLLAFLAEEILPYPLQGMKKTGKRQKKTEITPIRRFPNASLRVRTLSRIHSLSSPGKVDILLYDRRFF